MAARKRGKKASYATHPRTEKIIEGLYEHRRKNGTLKCYYFVNQDGKQVSCTTKIDKAIQRLRAYQRKNALPEYTDIPEEALV